MTKQPESVPPNAGIPPASDLSEYSDYGPEAGGEAPHPVEYISPEEESQIFGYPIYADEQAPISASSILEPKWWSLASASTFIEGADEDDEEPKPFFEGLKRLERAIRSGQLRVFGSIDGAVPQQISVAAWTQFQFIPKVEVRDDDGNGSFDVIVRSLGRFRAAALHDLSQPSFQYVVIPNSMEPEPTYHRVVSNPFVEKNEVRKVFPTASVAPKQQKAGRKQRRLIATLPKMIIRGKTVFPDRGNVPYSDIARAVIRRWEIADESQGKSIQYDLSTEEQAVRRFYLAMNQRSSDI